MIRIAAVLSLLLGVARLDAQESARSPRVAALLYAMAHGLDVPHDSIAVAWESNFDIIDSSTASPEETLRSEARTMADRIGKTVGVVSAKEYTKCVGTRCGTSSRLAVLVVSEARESSKGTGVLIRLYAPGRAADGSERTITDVLVDVERAASGWVGVRNRIAPGTTKVGPPKSGG